MGIVSVEFGSQEFLTQRSLTSEDFFEYEKRKTTQGIKLANTWLMYEAFGESAKGLKFRQKGTLLAALTNPLVTLHDDLPLAQSSDFTVHGNHFVEAEDSGEYFDEFIAKAAESPLTAYRWAIPRVFVLNGKPIQPDEHFTSEDGIGFSSTAVLVQWLSSFLQNR